MKTGTVKIQGKEYILCLSPRVLKNLQEKNGRSIYEELDALTNETNMGDVFWLLAQMLKAGDKYATQNGIEHNTPIPTEDDLLDFVGLDEYNEIFASLGNALSNGVRADIVADAKNANATLNQAAE